MRIAEDMESSHSWWRTMANWEDLKIWAAISDDANWRKEMGQKPKQTREEP